MASFLEVINVRTQREEGFVRGRSHCDKCGQVLRWWELIPLVSFIILKGKCRYCHHKIKARYFISEIVLGSIFLIMYLRNERDMLSYLQVSVLFLTVINDLDTMSVPVTVLRIYAVISGLLYLISGEYLSSLISAVIISLFLIILNVFLKGIGEADIMLIGFFTLSYGWKKALMALILSVYLCLPCAIYLVHKRKDTGTMIPFCPFIAWGMLISMLFFENIWTIFTKISSHLL